MPNDQIQVALKPPSATTGWQMKVGSNGWTTGPNYTPITVGYQHKADITFTIQNDPGQNAAFAANPILLPAKDKVFDAPTINSDTSFTITDKNPDVDHQIPYVLVFKGNVPKLDPIIDNDGGGHLTNDGAVTPAATSNVAFFGLGGFAIGVIVTLIFRAISSRKGPVER